jgi:transposase
VRLGRQALGVVDRCLGQLFLRGLLICARKKASDKELKQLLAETRTTVTDLHGIGPSGAARLVVEVGDITRFRSPAHFDSRTGTAPIDASSVDHVRHVSGAVAAGSFQRPDPRPDRARRPK